MALPLKRHSVTSLQITTTPRRANAPIRREVGHQATSLALCDSPSFKSFLLRPSFLARWRPRMLPQRLSVLLNLTPIRALIILASTRKSRPYMVLYSRFKTLGSKLQGCPLYTRSHRFWLVSIVPISLHVNMLISKWFHFWDRIILHWNLAESFETGELNQP